MLSRATRGERGDRERDGSSREVGGAVAAERAVAGQGGERDEQRDPDARADLLRRDVDRARDAVIALRDAGPTTTTRRSSSTTSPPGSRARSSRSR
jgi:hypothetical protein